MGEQRGLGEPLRALRKMATGVRADIEAETVLGSLFHYRSWGR